MDATTEARKIAEAGGAFRGARDFFLAYRILGARRADPEVKAARAPWTMQAHATCAAFALELVLKTRLLLEGADPPRDRRRGHSYVAIFEALSPHARAGILQGVLFDGKPGTEADFRQVLDEMEGTFEGWRYLHEGKAGGFNEQNMATAFLAVQASVIRAMPNFEPWPGVIWEGAPRW